MSHFMDLERHRLARYTTRGAEETARELQQRSAEEQQLRQELADADAERAQTWARAREAA